jgi:uncharacterized membrane protein
MISLAPNHLLSILYLFIQQLFMKLSSQKDLLLVITLSGAVLIMNWLGLLKGSGLSTLITILALFLPGYAIITAIWPDDESMGWTLRAGVGFVLGLVFVLFLPLIFNSLKWGYLAIFLPLTQ